MLAIHTLEDIHPHSSNYAHAVGIPTGARLLMSNGHMGTRADGTTPEDVEAQTEVIFDRLEAVLKADDMSLADIARITTFLTEVDDQEAYKRVRDRVLGDHKPANPILIVKALVRPLLKVEIEIIAAKVD